MAPHIGFTTAVVATDVDNLNLCDIETRFVHSGQTAFYSVLSRDKLEREFGIRMLGWRDQLGFALGD